MRRSLRLGIAACLFCNALQSAGQKQESPAAPTTHSQAPPTDTHEPTTPSGAATPALMKVCGEKNPPPCATAPTPISRTYPKYSDEARKANYQGSCTLGLTVEPDGHVSHIHMISSLGMGLDEKAIEAVNLWRFKPGMMDGKPVAVEIAIEMSFSLQKGGKH